MGVGSFGAMLQCVKIESFGSICVGEVLVWSSYGGGAHECVWVGMSRGALGLKHPAHGDPKKNEEKKERKPMRNDRKIYVSPLPKFPFYQKKYSHRMAILSTL